VWLRVVCPGRLSCPVLSCHVLSVLVEGRLRSSSGAVWLSSMGEEFSFTLGQAQAAQGLEMAVAYMSVGERAHVWADAAHAFTNATRRPADVPADAALWFDVTLTRFEKEPNLHQIKSDEKVAFAKS
jgi:FKBP-type peptidyl-prolyl cis-trans isomerase